MIIRVSKYRRGSIESVSMYSASFECAPKPMKFRPPGGRKKDSQEKHNARRMRPFRNRSEGDLVLAQVPRGTDVAIPAAFAARCLV